MTRPRHPAALGLAASAACASAAALAIVANAAPPSGAAATPQLVLRPVADAQVSAGQPRRNFGGSSLLRVASAPRRRVYLRFDLRKATPVERATLVLPVAVTSPGRLAVGRAVGAWSERKVTYRRSPAILAGRLVNVTRRTRSLAIDVTAIARRGGLVSLGLAARSGSLTFASRERKARSPRLVVLTRRAAIAGRAPASVPGSSAPASPSTPAPPAAPLPPAPTAPGPFGWWQADLHVHSVVSADAFPDLGVLAEGARAQGFNAIFLTDHNLGSNFTISGLTANHMTLDETLDSATGYFRRWTQGKDGTLTSSTNKVASSPAHTGTKALSLSSTAPAGASGETFAWTKRGPNFRPQTGATTLTFWVDPVTITGGSSLYVSAAIGGDATVGEPTTGPVGYTANGVVSRGKSTILVWYLGSPPPTSLFPGAHVYEMSLGTPTPGVWTRYSFNPMDAVQALPPEDQPASYDALSDLKIAAVGSGGTASASFDDYAIDAASASAQGPALAADEFVARNAIIDSGSLDGPTFRVFPSTELGTNKHAQRFNFDIRDPSQYVSYPDGIDGIAPTQQSGYPAQLNHPGVPGGVSDAEATTTNAEGADLLEVRQQNMVDDWDQILRQNPALPPIGTWGGDNHIGSWSGSSQATFIRAPLDFGSLMRALYEGRAYMGVPVFNGGLALNLDPGSQEPYPARYPVYVPQGQGSASVHLVIGAGLRAGSDQIRWLSNQGSTTKTSVVAQDVATGSSYEAIKQIALSGAATYVRAEVRDAAGQLRAMTEPIIFERTVPGLPAGMSYRVDGVDNPGGTGYTKIFTKGITASSYDAAAQRLSLTLSDPPGALASLRVTSARPPASVTVDGAPVAQASSLAAVQGATGSSWYYDAATGTVLVRVLHGSGTASASLQW